MNADELIRAKVEDRIAQCRDGWYVTSTALMDTHEQAIAFSAARQNSAGVRTIAYGGYEGAERRMLVFVPLELPVTDEEAVSGLLEVLRIMPAVSGRLSHRDYLGSVLGLGIDRSVTGDILVRDDGADMIVMPEITDFLLQEYRQAGRTAVSVKRVPPEEILIPETRIEVIKDTVPSVRLDNVAASAFKISRSKAADAIRAGIVSVDHLECLKPDARLEEGAVLVLKGKGKAVLKEIGGESKKSRVWIKIERYI